MNNFDSIIFDLDGTLWDCSRAMAFAMNEVYHKFGINKHITDTLARYLCSLPYTQYNEYLLEGVPEELHSTILPYLAEYANSSVEKYSDIALYDGAGEGLTALSSKFKLFIVSNCGVNYLNLFLQRTSVGKLFTDAVCYGHNHNNKCDNIKLICEKYQLTPCYIGDSPGDESAAKSAGVAFCFAGYGACFQNSLTDSHIFESFSDITAYFLDK